MMTFELDLFLDLDLASNPDSDCFFEKNSGAKNSRFIGSLPFFLEISTINIFVGRDILEQ
jgi:hypothetical protein